MRRAPRFRRRRSRVPRDQADGVPHWILRGGDVRDCGEAGIRPIAGSARESSRPLRCRVVRRCGARWLQLGPHVPAPAQHRLFSGAAAADASRRHRVRLARSHADARSAHGAGALGRRRHLARRLSVGALLSRAPRSGPRRPRSRGERGAAARGIPVCALLQRRLHRVACFYSPLSAPSTIFVAGEWRAASAWGLLLGLTRPNGCFASVPLAILGAQQLWEGAEGAYGPGGCQGCRGARCRGASQVPRVPAWMPAKTAVRAMSAG